MIKTKLRRCFTPLLSLASLALLVAGCSKDQNSPTIDFGPNEGFSYRDGSNFPTGAQDATDWTLDAQWNAQEKALFQSLNVNLDEANKVAATPGLIGGAYPNPATNAIGFSYSTPAATKSKILVVDNHYQVLRETESTSPSQNMSFTLNLAASGFKAGQRYRLYYVLYDNANAVYLKGHGDIKIQ